MTEENQKKLYEHYKKLSVEGETPKQRTECGRYAKEILNSFPQFEIIKVEEKKINSKEIKEKK